MKFPHTINDALDCLFRIGIDCTRMILTVSYGTQALYLLASVSLAVALDPQYSQWLAAEYSQTEFVAFMCWHAILNPRQNQTCLLK